MRRIIPRLLAVATIALGGCAGATPSAAEDAPFSEVAAAPWLGFSPAGLEAQRVLERSLRDSASGARCADDVRALGGAPPIAGGAAALRSSRYVAARLRDAGFQVETEVFEVLVPLPVSLDVELTKPVAFAAGLRAEASRLDLDTATSLLPPAALYGTDADLEADLLYANEGRREDLEELRRRGLEVAGRILLVRFGAAAPEAVVRSAEAEGARAVLFFSDPALEGFARGEVHPKGPWRPASGLRRVSILATSLQPGDPGTPGRPALPGGEQPTYEEMVSLPGIPAASLSWEDARPLLENIGGAAVPPGWQGAGEFTWRLGGRDAASVRIAVVNDYRLRTIENVVATWPGAELPDEIVVVGARRDALGVGASEAASPTAVLLEAARLVADAARAGAPPRRTLRFAVWDGGAPGALGATEHGEARAAELRRGGVLHVDVGGAFALGEGIAARGSAAWAPFLDAVLGTGAAEGSAASSSFGSLGAGGDGAVFLQHLGVPTIRLDSGSARGAEGSAFDTFVRLRRLDPEFAAHARSAALLATLVLRVGRAELLPGDLGTQARALDGGLLSLAAARPELDLAPFRDAASRVEDAGRRLDAARRALAGRSLSPATIQTLDLSLVALERCLLLEEGFARRPWYRHVLDAPHLDGGRRSTVLPALTDALDGDRELARREAARSLVALERWAAAAEALAERFERLVGEPTEATR